MSRPTEKTLDKEVPGLCLDRVWWHREYRHIYPKCALSKKDRDALKRSGYEWWGRYWVRPCDEHDNLGE